MIRLCRAVSQCRRKSNQRRRLKCATANKIRKAQTTKTVRAPCSPPRARVGQEMMSDKSVNRGVHLPLVVLSRLIVCWPTESHQLRWQWKTSQSEISLWNKNHLNLHHLADASYPHHRGHVPKIHPVTNEGEDDNLIHIQPHMLDGSLALAFITLWMNHEYSWRDVNQTAMMPRTPRWIADANDAVEPICSCRSVMDPSDATGAPLTAMETIWGQPVRNSLYLYSIK